jgi:hypothetical protein
MFTSPQAGSWKTRSNTIVNCFHEEVLTESLQKKISKTTPALIQFAPDTAVPQGKNERYLLHDPFSAPRTESKEGVERLYWKKVKSPSQREVVEFNGVRSIFTTETL